ncbi:MAG: hypothetical protein RJA07_361 [Bacteroidota bacterium]|jgi:hypothetical protein
MKIVCAIVVLLFFDSANLFAQSYNYYYGNIHSHTGYSDGSKDSLTSGVSTPGKAYWFAKQTYHFDFLGISEHNHNSAGMVLADYAKGKTQSDTANANGTFAALYGMEYGVISNGGHVLVYGVDSLIGWDSVGVTPNYSIYNSEYTYSTLWSLITARSNTFCSLAHPCTGDYANLDGSSYSSAADQAIYGVAIRSGSAFSTTTTYTDAAATSYESFYKKYLALGYHVAPTIDADNHYTTFGRTNHGRTVVLARSLHRDSIIAAFRLMHFYASDDWNAQVSFMIDGTMMGTTYQSTSNPTILVSVSDPDIESVSNITIYRGIAGSGSNPTSVKSSNNVSSVTYNPTSFTLNAAYYYYAKITQADGDIMWTAPIWFTKTSGVGLPIDGITEFNSSLQNGTTFLTWTMFSKFDSIKVFRSSTFNNFIPLQTLYENETHFEDIKPIEGLNYYTLEAFQNGVSKGYSDITGISNHSESISSCTIFPNPISDYINLNITATNLMTGIIAIYTEEGREIVAKNVSLKKGENIVILNSKWFPTGIYLVDIRNEYGHIYSMKIVK